MSMYSRLSVMKTTLRRLCISSTVKGLAELEKPPKPKPETSVFNLKHSTSGTGFVRV